jgi:endonuclease/exonuclease/phosphatase family metal-dependent hydrolase
MRFVTYNIGYGMSRNGGGNLDRIAEAVDGADVIALQEVERFWPRSGMVDQPRQLGKRLPGYWWVFGPNIDLHSSETFPGEEADRRRQFGNMLLARRPILASRNIALTRCSHLPFSMQRGAIEGIVEVAEATLRVYSTHLCYLSAETRLTQIAAIREAHEAAAREGGAWAGEHPDKAVGWIVGDEPRVPDEAVLLGDMNFLPESQEYIEHVAPDAAEPCGFVDAWRAIGLGEEAGTTKIGHGRIDYGLVSPSLVGRITDAWVDRDADGSDHQPLWFNIDV